MELERARKLAGQIVEQLGPMCEKIEVAGSIRRGRPNVNDIDLVVLPKDGQLNALRERVKRNTRLITDGEENLIVNLTLNGTPGGGTRPTVFQLDVFIARPASTDFFQPLPSNWGTMLLNRTGSTAHNIFLVERAKSLGLRWNPYHGVFGKCPRTGRSGVCLASETEEEIFKVLGLEFVPPEKRER